ncbi:MAG TPA: pantoate--beta-alanine ligase [Moorella mulderi]|nr:pantoate--beta-alanine ligase [Moorella mulderi]
MHLWATIKEARAHLQPLRQQGKTIGLVPTMGYLHEGHLSLVRAARRENDMVVMSIFVNPTQFGPGEDLDRYPRDLYRDMELAEKAGVDGIFAPSVEEMYPEGYSTYVEVEGLSRVLCGASRPGHFRGVATVVSKLFNIIQPHRAYFGLKDYQQALIIKRMVEDLNFPVEIVTLPTVREPDGLALSSRNQYLTLEERAKALSLYRSLKRGEEMILKGIRQVQAIKEAMAQELLKHEVKIDYVEVCNPENLSPLEEVGDRALLAVAAWVGSTRLIDNLVVEVT